MAGLFDDINAGKVLDGLFGTHVLTPGGVPSAQAVAAATTPIAPNGQPAEAMIVQPGLRTATVADQAGRYPTWMLVAGAVAVAAGLYYLTRR